MQKVLVIDDDHDICFLLNKFLTKHGYEVHEALTARKAIELLEKIQVDVVLCDYRLEGVDGNTMITKIKEKQSVPVIIITGYNDLKIAVTAMKLGAFDFVLKPLFPQEILNTIKAALEKPVKDSPFYIEGGASALHPQGRTRKTVSSGTDYIFGDSYVFRQILQQISIVAPTDYSVIINGESGSGKEAIAQEIHKRSKRSHFPFFAIDCGALSKELAGSELFGHEKGSFTGAINQKTGCFEMANGGTIFLDEIINLPYDVQISLLRVIQERKMKRIGGNKDIILDVRIIIASNEKLWDAAQSGKFREDLFHRFNEFTIEVPPLRDRKEDIMLFASHFLDRANENLKKNIRGFSHEVTAIFKSYSWPGNLRELKNVVKRAALLTDGELIEDGSLPFEITNFSKLQFENKEEKSRAVLPDITAEPLKQEAETKQAGHSLKFSSIDHEYELIVKALKENNFNKSKAAKVLNIDRKTLYNKIALYQELVQRKLQTNG